MNDNTDFMPTFSFDYLGENGKRVSVTFEADDWGTALNEFVGFLQASGFILSKNSIAINANKHIMSEDHHNIAYFKEEV